jgi:putative transposase
MSYSIDLRERVVKFVEEGGSIAEGARLFDVSRPTIYQWIKKKSSGSLKDNPPKRPWKKIDPQALITFVQKHSDLTLAEYAKHFGIKPSSMFNAFKRLKITRKKRPCNTKKGMKASEQHF